MIKYREHRGSLAESMSTVREFEDAESLKHHVISEHGEGVVTIERYGYDERINWHSYIVCHNGMAV